MASVREALKRRALAVAIADRPIPLATYTGSRRCFSIATTAVTFLKLLSELYDHLSALIGRPAKLSSKMLLQLVDAEEYGTGGYLVFTDRF